MIAESGIETFRGAGGLCEGHRVVEVATPEAFAANPGLVFAAAHHSPSLSPTHAGRWLEGAMKPGPFSVLLYRRTQTS